MHSQKTADTLESNTFVCDSDLLNYFPIPKESVSEHDLIMIRCNSNCVSSGIRMTYDAKRDSNLRFVPAFQIISHHQNKEVNLVVTLSQNSPFPEGNYKLSYRIYDKSSGNTYDIAKDITIAASPNT
jgi:hypothetical protein